MQLVQATILRLQTLVSWFVYSNILTNTSQLFLFGGPNPWVTPTTNWTAVDDRVRGGSSQSHLSLLPNSNNIRFFGTLDTKTLGGAGFASQTTTGERVWDLSAYDGIQIEVVKGDGKTYTLIVKDDVPEEKREDGREKSSTSWEYDFKAGGSESEADGNMKVWVPWSSFNATYRGRDKKDAAPLKTSEIKRFSLMMRSFFEKQEGEFDLVLASISALQKSTGD